MSVGRRVGEENNWKGGLDLRCGKKRRMVVATEKEEEENRRMTPIEHFLTDIIQVIFRD